MSTKFGKIENSWINGAAFTELWEQKSDCLQRKWNWLKKRKKWFPVKKPGKFQKSRHRHLQRERIGWVWQVQGRKESWFKALIRRSWAPRSKCMLQSHGNDPASLCGRQETYSPEGLDQRNTGWEWRSELSKGLLPYPTPTQFWHVGFRRAAYKGKAWNW